MWDGTTNKKIKKFVQYERNVPHTVSSLTYANNTYADAPAIEKVKIKQVKKIKNCSDDKLMSEIFSAYNNKKIDQYVGDIIVKIYKKEDPLEQSLWNTDTSRLTYLLKKYIYDEESKWIIDKKGVDTVKNVIAPILDNIKIMAIQYQVDNNDNEDKDKVLLINTIFVKLLSDIDNKKLYKDILKYISSHFYLKNKKDKRLD